MAGPRGRPRLAYLAKTNFISPSEFTLHTSENSSNIRVFQSDVNIFLNLIFVIGNNKTLIIKK